MIVVIASDVKAPKYGTGRSCGRLKTDGLDDTVFRKVEIGLTPSTRGQKRRMLAGLDATREVYNAALQERRDAYNHPSKTRVSAFDQFKALTTVRQARPDVFAYGLAPLRAAIRRVDEAYAGFFRRVSAGQTPGFPRFKSAARYDTLAYDGTTSWSVNLETKTLYVQGIGDIRLSRSAVAQLRRYAARGGTPATLTLTRTDRTGKTWRACIGMAGIGVERTEPTYGWESVAGVDRGIHVPMAVAGTDTFATDAGTLLSVPAETAARVSALRRRIEDLQRVRAGKKKYGRAWRSLSKQIKRTHGKIGHINQNWARHQAKALVADYGVLAGEALNLAAMSRSAAGTPANPGVNVAAKSGLNRALAETALGQVMYWVHVKAEEAGRRTWTVPAPFTSQQCCRCGLVDAGNRDKLVFYCTGCGHYEHADVQAARNVRARALAAETAWAAAGRPGLTRPKPRLTRRKAGALALADAG